MLISTETMPDAALEPISSPAIRGSLRAGSLKRIASQQLLGGGHELVIEHSGQEYRLRLTRNDKLILTK